MAEALQTCFCLCIKVLSILKTWKLVKQCLTLLQTSKSHVFKELAGYVWREFSRKLTLGCAFCLVSKMWGSALKNSTHGKEGNEAGLARRSWLQCLPHSFIQPHQGLWDGPSGASCVRPRWPGLCSLLVPISHWMWVAHKGCGWRRQFSAAEAILKMLKVGWDKSFREGGAGKFISEHLMWWHWRQYGMLSGAVNSGCRLWPMLFKINLWNYCAGLARHILG